MPALPLARRLITSLRTAFFLNDVQLWRCSELQQRVASAIKIMIGKSNT